MVIDESLNGILPVVEDFVNEELDDSDQNDLIEENDTEVHDEEGEESTETEGATSEEFDERLKRGKNTIPKIDLHEINEGDERYDNIGGDDVASVEEAEMKSSSDSINDNGGDLFSEFYASTCSGDSVYDIFKNEDEIITEYYNVWLNTNKRIRERRFIKIPYSGLPQDTNY